MSSLPHLRKVVVEYLLPPRAKRYLHATCYVDDMTNDFYDTLLECLAKDRDIPGIETEMIDFAKLKEMAKKDDIVYCALTYAVVRTVRKILDVPSFYTDRYDEAVEVYVSNNNLRKKVLSACIKDQKKE